MNNRVGILLNHETYRGVRTRRTGYEHIGLYNKAAKRLGLDLLYMTLSGIDPTTARGLIYRNGQYVPVVTPIPKVTHNRAFAFSEFQKKRMTRLAARSLVFNRSNRYSKYRIYAILVSNKQLADCLPDTKPYSLANLRKAMMTKRSLYLKPVNNSVGNGIIRMERNGGSSWTVQSNTRARVRLAFGEAMNRAARIIGKQRYLIQETIPLATYKGRQYDLRVSVQRGDGGVWGVTGMVGKVAPMGSHVTNVAKGGKVKPCNLLLRESGFNVSALKQSIREKSLRIAKYLGRYLPQLADIGLDIGVDRFGRVKLIEVNARDQRISFKMAGHSDTFYRTYETPLRYAKHLLQQSLSSRRKFMQT